MSMWGALSNVTSIASTLKNQALEYGNAALDRLDQLNEEEEEKGNDEQTQIESESESNSDSTQIQPQLQLQPTQPYRSPLTNTETQPAGSTPDTAYGPSSIAPTPLLAAPTTTTAAHVPPPLPTQTPTPTHGSNTTGVTHLRVDPPSSTGSVSHSHVAPVSVALTSTNLASDLEESRMLLDARTNETKILADKIVELETRHRYVEQQLQQTWKEKEDQFISERRQFKEQIEALEKQIQERIENTNTLDGARQRELDQLKQSLSESMQSEAALQATVDDLRATAAAAAVIPNADAATSDLAASLAEQRARGDTLQADLDTCQSLLVKQKGEIQALRDKLSFAATSHQQDSTRWEESLRDTTDSHARELDQLSKQVSRLIDEKESLESDLVASRLASDHSDLKQQLFDLNRSLDEKIQENTIIREEMEEIVLELKVQNEKNEEMIIELTKKNEMLQTNLTEMSQKVDHQTTTLSEEHTRTVQQLEHKCQEFERQLGARTSTIEALTDELHVARAAAAPSSDAAANEAAIVDLNDRLRTLESTNADLRSELERALDDLNQTRGTLAETQVQLKVASEELTSLQRQLEETRMELAEMKESRTLLEGKCAASTSTIARLTDENASLTSDLRSSSAEVATLTSQVASQSHELSMLRASASDGDSASNLLTQQLSERNAELQQAQTQIVEMRNQLQTSKEQLSQLESTLATTNERVDELKIELSRVNEQQSAASSSAAARTSELEESLRASQSEVARLVDRCAGHASEQERVVGLLESSRRQLDDARVEFESQLRSQQSAHDEERQHDAMLRQEIDQERQHMIQELDSIRRQFEATEKELADVRTEYENLSDKTQSTLTNPDLDAARAKVERLNDELDAHRLIEEDLRKELATLQHRLDGYLSDLTSGRNDSEQLQQRLSVLETELRESRTRASEYEATSEEWKLQLTKSEEEVLQLEGKISAIQEEANGKEKQLQEEINQLRHQVSSLEERLRVAADQTDAQTELASVSSQLSTALSSLADRDAELSAVRETARVSVESATTNLSTAIAALEAEHVIALKKIEDEQARLTAESVARETALQLTIATLQETIAAAEQQKQTIINTWTNEQQIYETNVKLLDDARQSNAALQKRLTDIVATNAALVPRSEHDALQSHLTSLTAKYDTSLTSIESLKKECRTFLAGETTLTTEIEQLKQSVVREENEKKDLILQLKTLQLQSLESETHASKKAAALQMEIGALRNELTDLHSKHTALTNELAEMSVHTSNDLFTSSSEISKLRELNSEHLAEIDRLRSHMRESAAHAKSMAIDHAQEAEQLRQEIQLLQTETDNMHVIQAEFQHTQDKYKELQVEHAGTLVSLANLQSALETMQAGTEAEIKRLEDELREARTANTNVGQSSTDYAQLQSQYDLLATADAHQKQQLSNYTKYIYTLELENTTLRKGLEGTMERLKLFSNDENLIDRRLVVKMLVTYFERPQQADVLNLMYRMLKFTPDEIARVEKGRVGIGGRLKGWVSYLPSLMTDAGAGAAGSRTDNGSVDDSSLADLWVDFLLKETEKSAATALSSPDPQTTLAQAEQLTPKTKSRIAANAAAAVGQEAISASPPVSMQAQPHPMMHMQFGHSISGPFPSPMPPMQPPVQSSPEVWPPVAMQQLAPNALQYTNPSNATPHLIAQPTMQPAPFQPIQPYAVSAASSLMPPPPLHPNAAVAPTPTQFAFQTMQPPTTMPNTAFVAPPPAQVAAPNGFPATVTVAPTPPPTL